MLKEYLKDNNLIIAPNSLKKKIIHEMNNYDLVNYKIMDINEFLENYCFSYDKKTIYYVMNKLNIKEEIVKEYLSVLNYLEDKNYNSFKLNELLSLKKDLIDNNLLTKNNIFLNYLSNTNIIVVGYHLDSFYLDILNKYNYSILEEEYDKKELNVYEFNSINDEIAFVCNDILDKINNGIDINNIKIINSGSEYDLVLTRIFNWFNIPLDSENKISLYDIEVGKKIISLLNDGNNFTTIINSIKDDVSEDVLNKIINIFNSYVDFNSIPVDMIIYDLKNTNLSIKHLNNSVRIVSFDELEIDDIGYVIGFNKENYPIVYKDEDILSDNMKKELNLFVSNDKNILERNELINNLYKYNLVITYKLKDAFNNYEESNLVSTLDMNVIKGNISSYNKSNLYNKMKLSMEYDKYNKYGILSDTLKLLRPSYRDLEYDTYSNKYKGINKDVYLSKINTLNLSYTSINTYFKCSFRYYLERVLKLKDTSFDDFYLNLGNIFHYVLSKYRDNDFVFDKCWNEEASKYNFTLDKMLLLNKLKQELKFDIEVIKKQEAYSNMHKYLFEKEFNVNIPNKHNIKVNFTGKIDKIIYDDNKSIVSLIDYKTGDTEINLNNIIYGLDMQLPIYMYLVKRSDLFKNVDIAGFYLQIVVNREIKGTYDKSTKDLKVDALKLQGYSNTDINITSAFDCTYEKSEMIKSLKTKKDGTFDGRSKVLSNEELDKIDSIIDGNIKNVTDDILDAKFDINPKKIGKDLVGCKYCPYSDICFMQQGDIVELEEYKKLEFLGGEE